MKFPRTRKLRRFSRDVQRGKVNQSQHTAPSLRVGRPHDFVVQHAAAIPFQLSLLQTVQDQQHRLRFQSDPLLFLIIEGTIYAADIQVNLVYGKNGILSSGEAQLYLAPG